MELKDRLKSARTRARLTQSQLADIVGIKQASISEIERGLSRTSGHLVKIAQACGVNPIWLAEGVGLPEPAGQGQIEDALAPVDKRSSAELVRAMLTSIGKGLPEEAHSRILAAVEDADSATPELITADYSSLRPRNEGNINPQYDIRAAMGDGQVPPEYNQAVRNLVVREEILREKGVTYTSTTALAMITGWGQSMEGTINDKDLVIIDRGITEFIGEGIYVITWHQELYIKRIMRLDEGHYRLISDNQHYENQTARIDDVTIQAKVLLIWNARKA